jgi:hypothetical protein
MHALYYVEIKKNMPVGKYLYRVFWWSLERGPLSLVSATEELLDSKVAAPV